MREKTLAAAKVEAEARKEEAAARKEEAAARKADAKAKVDAAKVHSQTGLRKNTMSLKQEKRKLLMDLLDAKRRMQDGEDADACVTLLTESLNEIQQEIDDNEHKIAELAPEQQQQG